MKSFSFQKTIIQSCIYFVAYVVTFLLLQHLTVALINLFGHNAIATFNQIENISSNADDWQRNQVTYGLSTGPLLLTIFSFFLLAVTREFFKGASVLKYVLVWLTVISFNFFLVGLTTNFAGKISYYWGLYQGFAVVFAWWDVSFVIMFAIAVFSILLSILFGFLMHYEFLIFSTSIRKLKSYKERIKVLSINFLLPSFLGTIIILSLCNSYSYSLHIGVFINLCFIFLGLILRFNSDITYLRMRFNLLENGNSSYKNIFNFPIYFPVAFAVIIWLFVFFLQ